MTRTATAPNPQAVALLAKAQQELAEGELTAKTANALFAISAPTQAIRDYVQWAIEDHGAPNKDDQLIMAALMSPIELPSNPKMEAELNRCREKGTVTGEDAKALMDAAGKLSLQEYNRALQLVAMVDPLPGFDQDVFDKEVMPAMLEKAAERKAGTRGLHRRRVVGLWATTIAAMGAFVGIMFGVGPDVVAEALNSGDAAANLLTLAGAFVGAGGSGWLTARAAGIPKTTRKLAEYGIED